MLTIASLGLLRVRYHTLCMKLLATFILCLGWWNDLKFSIRPDEMGFEYHSVERVWSAFRMTVMSRNANFRSCSISTVNCSLGSMLLNACTTCCSVFRGIAMNISSTYFLNMVISNGRDSIAALMTESSTISATIGDSGLPIAVATNNPHYHFLKCATSPTLIIQSTNERTVQHMQQCCTTSRAKPNKTRMRENMKVIQIEERIA